MCIIVFAGKKFASVQSAIKPFAKEATYTPMAGNILFLIRRLNLALEQQSRAQAARQFGPTPTPPPAPVADAATSQPPP